MPVPGSGIKFLWIVLVIALVVGAWALSSLFQNDAFNVRATVKGSPTGTVQTIVGGSGPESSEYKDPETGSGSSGGSPPMIVELGGNQGQVLYINTDIDYGTVFPGESLTDYFTVYLTTETSLDYSIELTWIPGNSDKDMRPHLTVWKDPSESEVEPNNIADGPAGDYTAEGTLSGSDISDKWLVRFDVPGESGD